MKKVSLSAWWFYGAHGNLGNKYYLKKQKQLHTVFDLEHNPILSWNDEAEGLHHIHRSIWEVRTSLA